MLDDAISVALALLALAAALSLWRLAKGPTRADRILALDTLSINGIGVVVLIGLAARSTLYFEAALLIAMLGFVGTVSLCKFLLGGDIIE